MKLPHIAALALAAATLGGCAVVASPTTGLLYTKVQGPIVTGNSANASKSGQSCATNILGLISIGDASIDAAKKAGSIKDVATREEIEFLAGHKDVASVDHDSTSILGLYGTFCTVVKGN